MTMIARCIKENLGWNGDARLYELSVPMTYYGWDEGATSHVVVSAADVPFTGPTTYIFPASPDGEPIELSEMRGSFIGGKDHAQALRRAGYEIAR